MDHLGARHEQSCDDKRERAYTDASTRMAEQDDKLLQHTPPDADGSEDNQPSQHTVAAPDADDSEDNQPLQISC
ncbi:MAG: hypothetical protein FRX48_01410 [Lasallia pustulata]|uniref:Uncharacterized protein n=1 Tax=Lasallia pustulata TaxID=136370 RepID=A0A5M8Q082_9LECA|nr:MAG: hypothetical protein FRX48_01410 [Lasallia pustulata]